MLLYPPVTIIVNLLHAQETLTGTGYYAYYLIEEMLKHPRQPRIIGITSPLNHEAFAMPEPHPLYKRLMWGRPWKSVGMRRLEEWIYLQGFIKRLRKRFDKCTFWGPSNFAPLWRSGPTVVTIHDMTFFDHPEMLSPVRRWYWHFWTRRTLEVANDHLTVSEDARRQILRHFPMDPNLIDVIPNGTGRVFYVGRDEKGKPERERALRAHLPALPENYIFFLGTLTAHKNVPRLITALAMARDRGCEDMHLVLAGKRGAQYEKVAEAIKAHHLHDYVHELGYVEDQWLPALYENARAHVLPSFSEGFGMPITEAMAAGTPVITTNTGAMAEIGGDAALLADPYSAKEFADHLEALWKNEELYQRKRAEGLERADYYTWERAADETYWILEASAYLANY